MCFTHYHLIYIYSLLKICFLYIFDFFYRHCIHEMDWYILYSGRKGTNTNNEQGHLGKRHPFAKRHTKEENLWFVVRHPTVREGYLAVSNSFLTLTKLLYSMEGSTRKKTQKMHPNTLFSLQIIQLSSNHRYTCTFHHEKNIKTIFLCSSVERM
jgi:hypothetical protein